MRVMRVVVVLEFGCVAGLVVEKGWCAKTEPRGNKWSVRSPARPWLVLAPWVDDGDSDSDDHRRATPQPVHALLSTLWGAALRGPRAGDVRLLELLTGELAIAQT